MGYRLYYAKHYDPDWSGGWFGSGSVSGFEDLYYAKFGDNGWMSEYEDQCEIDRQDIEKYLKHLKTLKPEKSNHYMKDCTNEEVTAALEDILTSEDEMIRIEWF